MSHKKAGVLLHPTSLPSGKLDEQAWRFLDWMVQAKLSIWQMLPLTHPVQGLSPYQSVSAFAMNPALLPTNWLDRIDETDFQAYDQSPPHWLNDYALFMSLRQHFKMASWVEWPEIYRYRDFEALTLFAETHAYEIQFLKKQQFVLHQIWQELKATAHQKEISLFGDMPIFVAYDSVDVWVNPHLFKLDENLNPTVVTGVPPDYFSETGQRWGNPHYDWDEMQKDGFQWWHHRIQSDLSLFDLIRIDHFRGLESSWEIDANEETAVNGRWMKVPGQLFLDSLQKAFPKLPLVAEDLGIITPEVTALKERYHLPGMSVLQFGFNGLPDNPHSLSEQVENSVVYTGTHDNDTSLGWWESLEDSVYKNWVLSQLPASEESMPWPLIDAAFQSVASMAIIPMQDFLSLGSEDRMNTPGTIENNWTWQFRWDQMTPEITEKIAGLVQISGRSNTQKSASL